MAIGVGNRDKCNRKKFVKIIQMKSMFVVEEFRRQRAKEKNK
jgi:hypothetical protein